MERTADKAMLAVFKCLFFSPPLLVIWGCFFWSFTSPITKNNIKWKVGKFY